MAKKPSTTNSTPQLDKSDDGVFAYILDFSRENLYFPMMSDISDRFDFSRTYPYEVIERLVAVGKIEKIGRYNFRIAKAFR